MTNNTEIEHVALAADGMKVLTTTQRIWKFDIPMTSHFTLEMPTKSRVLCVQVQQRKVEGVFGYSPFPEGARTSTPCIWAIVEPANEKVRRHFFLRGTGHPLLVAVPDRPNEAVEAHHLEYVGTFQLHEGELVMHLFSVPESV
jgi:hypothetical protein